MCTLADEDGDVGESNLCGREHFSLASVDQLSEPNHAVLVCQEGEPRGAVSRCPPRKRHSRRELPVGRRRARHAVVRHNNHLARRVVAVRRALNLDLSAQRDLRSLVRVERPDAVLEEDRGEVVQGDLVVAKCPSKGVLGDGVGRQGVHCGRAPEVSDNGLLGVDGVARWGRGGGWAGGCGCGGVTVAAAAALAATAVAAGTSTAAAAAAAAPTAAAAAVAVAAATSTAAAATAAAAAAAASTAAAATAAAAGVGSEGAARHVPFPACLCRHSKESDNECNSGEHCKNRKNRCWKLVILWGMCGVCCGERWSDDPDLFVLSHHEENEEKGCCFSFCNS